MGSQIVFHNEDVSYRLTQRRALRAWFEQAFAKEKKAGGEINFIFCSDTHLHGINVQYLSHDTYTDIITFDYSDQEVIAGDIFISVDRVRENAKTFSVPLKDELHRVMIHGLLHLMGYKDKTDKEQEEMTAKEDYYLTLRSF